MSENEMLYKGGHAVGSMIGWALRRALDAIRKSSEEREMREALRPGDPNRVLPDWQVETGERALNTAFRSMPDAVAEAMCPSGKPA